MNFWYATESTYNLQARVQGHCDESVLTRSQGAQVGTALQGIQFDAIYARPLQRAQEITEIVLSVLRSAGAVLRSSSIRQV